jgi:hypothetical protein
VKYALPILVAAVALCAGCGGGGEEGAGPTATAAGPARFLGRAGLERGLGNAFHAGLYRLAVMSQPSDGATDLGQDLPTGSIDAVSCSKRAGRHGDVEVSTCDVRWRTAAGGRRLTRYQVRRYSGGCFSAGARPPLPDHRDPTIEGYSVHPLNALVSPGRGCS